MNVAFKTPLSRRSAGLDVRGAVPADGHRRRLWHAPRCTSSVVEGLSALISRHREPDTEILRFPPVMNRRHLEKSGYLKSFPHLLGCVSCLQRQRSRKSAPRSNAFDAGGDWTVGAVAGRPRAEPRPPAIRSIRWSRAAAAFPRRACCSTSPATASATSRRAISTGCSRSACANTSASARRSRSTTSASAG